MAVNLQAPGPLLPVPGVRLAAAAAQVKSAEAAPGAQSRNDLAVVEFAEGTVAAGVFTQSGFAAPPVQLCRERLAGSNRVRALVINSGNANAATGERGLQDARQLCADVAEQLSIAPEAVLPFSTGVIGEFLPVERMQAGYARCCGALAADGWLAAAEAIMTTDTLPKACSRELSLGGETVTITGMAKGAGMMQPDMATMLAYIACDARVSSDCARALVGEIADASFNRLTVDGDTSTNDSFVLACTGHSAAAAVESVQDAHYAALRDALTAVAVELAQAIVRDGEGATKFVTVTVNGARTQAEATQVAFAVANSPLVKTAMFAGDPNWGRFCMAIGKAGLDDFDQFQVALYLDEVCIARAGLVAVDYEEAAAAAVMAKPEYSVRIELGRGAASDMVWTSDLSYEYVRVNAEYRT